MKRWADGFIAVDWGTTNRRAYLIEKGGQSSAEFEDGKGILSVRRGEFEAAIAEIRERLGEWPMLLAGMVGSNRGWVDAPYVPCPAGGEDLARALVRVGEDVAIVPGVSLVDGRCDVMRGEEVQLIGAIASGQIPRDCLVCHPGTHNKWVRVRNARIESFRTVMTGELFSLLAKHSILSDALADKAMYDAPFRDGVNEGMNGSALAADLFSVRASVVLGKLPKEHAVSFASGLLIGQDVRVGLEQMSGLPTIIMGRPDLTKLYRMALSEVGVDATVIDGEGAFIAGACNIVEQIQ